jgi:hypothetical protein
MWRIVIVQMKNHQEHRNQGKENWIWKEKKSNVWFGFSFEEEQQELKKSLSKDWCDKMDNEEAEEKKLHR